MPTLPRLRQVALVAAELKPVADDVEGSLGLSDPFHDPEVGEFGLENAVWAVGDTFLEVVAPVQEGTTAGRYLAKRGGDGGYMAIFEVEDMAEARRRVADLGVRVVWQIDLDDMAGTHLHPQDVPGAIVSLDTADPPGSWRWAGPAWSGRVPDHGPGGLRGVTVAVDDPVGAAQRWAAVLGVEPDGTSIVLADGQTVRFAPSAPSVVGIVAVDLAVPTDRGREMTVGGVRFCLVDPRGT